MSDDTDKRDGTIQSVSIAARFLRLLANADAPLALGSLAKMAETGNSTAHRYMQSLMKEGLAAQDPLSGLYFLGPAALDIGTAALKRIEPVEIAARHIKELASDHPASGGVAIWTERGPTLVRWYRSALYSISSLGLGDVLPVDNTACGLVFQAFLNESRIREVRAQQPDHFRGTPPTAEDLDQVRTSFWAERTDHLLPGITGQAVPVFDAQGELACVMTTVSNLGRARKEEDRYALFATGKAVAAETGGNARFP